MEKTRVPKGENYYWLSGLLEVCSSIEYYNSTSDAHYRCGNYFHSREEAEQMAKKLRAVLAGADVIETPSEEEIKERLDIIIPHNPCDTFVVEGICKHLVGWLKPKIVK